MFNADGSNIDRWSEARDNDNDVGRGDGDGRYQALALDELIKKLRQRYDRQADRQANSQTDGADLGDCVFKVVH